MQKERKTTLHWHPAFVDAIRMELKPYLDKIEILPEVPLTTEPLKIDCIIIKKSKGLVINKNFAVIFRDWNIMEYKSPQDHVSINDFHKVYAYACLYSVIKNIPVEDITISFVESRYPKKLIDFLKRARNYSVEKSSSGVYTIKGDVFAIQIIDSRHLSEVENLWLKNLSAKLDIRAVNKVITVINNHDKTVSLEAYIDVISRANAGLFEEAMEMRAPTLKQMIMNSKVGAGWIEEWQAKAEAKGLANGIKKGIKEGLAKVEVEKADALAAVARNLKSAGMSNKLISQYTGLSLAKIKKL
jgi:hypothetical protein